MTYRFARKLPNILTLSRIFAGIAFLTFLFYTNKITLLLIICFSAIAATDLLDGWLARKLNAMTKLGRFLDPMADKLILLGTFGYLYLIGSLPAWFFLLYSFRELIQICLRIFHFYNTEQDIPTFFASKLKTFLSYVYCIFLLFAQITSPLRDFFLFNEINMSVQVLVLILSYLGLSRQFMKK